MKGGGGLTWVGWVLLGVGGMLVYAGMTGQSLAAELAAVLNGRSPKAPAQAPATPGGNGDSGITNGSAGGGVGGSSSGSHPATIPNPTYGGTW